MSDRTTTKRLTGRAWLAAAGLALAVAAGGPATAQTTDIKMQIYQGGPQILPLIAQQQGFFERNGLNVELVVVATGPQAANALVSGSVDLAILAPLNVAPLLTQGIELTAVTGLQRMFTALVGPPGSASTWPDSLTQLKGKRIGVLALGAAGHLICEAALQAAGLKSGEYEFVATGGEPASGQALEGGSIDAACINPQTRIPLNEKGFVTLFDYLNPGDPEGYPESFRPMLNLSFVQLWARTEWVNGNPETIEKLMKALAEAYFWMADPANFPTVITTVRGSIYDIPAFEGAIFDSYLHAMIDAHQLLFSYETGDTWVGVVKAAMNVDLPAPGGWVREGSPADLEALRAIAGQ